MRSGSRPARARRSTGCCGARHARGAETAERVFPIVLRVEGYVGEKPEHVQVAGALGHRRRGKQYVFHVTRLQPIGIDIAYWTILNALEPLPVTLTLYGDPPI